MNGKKVIKMPKDVQIRRHFRLDTNTVEVNDGTFLTTTLEVKFLVLFSEV